MRDIPESRMITPEPHLNRLDKKYSFIFCFSPFFLLFSPCKINPCKSKSKDRYNKSYFFNIVLLIKY